MAGSRQKCTYQFRGSSGIIGPRAIFNQIFFFSETRCKTQDVFIEGSHRLVCSNDASARSPASGVAILVHHRWTTNIKHTICLNDRVMAVDLKISQKTIRLIAVYLPHSGYDRKYFQDTFIDIEVLANDAMDKGYTIILGGDFNLSLDQGYRGEVMEEFCSSFSMNIAGGVLMGNDANMWTWKSPSGEYQRKDYILHSRSLRSDDTSSNLELDMGSDHRNVSTSISIMSSQ